MAWTTRTAHLTEDVDLRTAASPVVDLGDALARDPLLAGAKAAALAVARANGLPVLPGVVITTTAAASDALAAWSTLDGPIAVRSSSPVEDQASSSMAGQFTTVLDVVGWDAAVDAIGQVRASAHGEPMAVLLQPMCDAVLGGVLFGLDPVSGETDRIVVEVVAGGPSALVSGRATATRIVLSQRGRVLETSGGTRMSQRQCIALAALARDAARTFGGPQDIEWAIDAKGTLWLLQSRPITAVGITATGPDLGPGPVAETFPDPLSPLELDLWAAPLRAAIIEALRLVGANPRRAIDASPVLVDVGGRLAVDLDLFEGRDRSGLLAKLDPRPGARRFAASWRVGRLRRALPLLAHDVVREVDEAMRAVPRLTDLDADELLALLGRCRLALRSVHGHEILSGVLTTGDGATGIEHALDAVASGRTAGLADAEIVDGAPSALALVPPRIGGAIVLPDVDRRSPHETRALGHREALRLRARWLHELTARAALALGERLAASGCLRDPILVRWLQLGELIAIVRDGAPSPSDLGSRVAATPAPPLPPRFRLAADGSVVAAVGSSSPIGRGAGGGRGVGVVAGPEDAADATVLVVRTLDPRLASLLPRRAGLVAETGSALSHLAIVARELGVPTVVGVANAVERFPPGTRVVVDGVTGTVEVTA